jgi:hypothetical protein
LARANSAQVLDNLASFDVVVSTDHLRTLDEASQIELGFPYQLYEKEPIRAFLYGGLRDRILA